MKPAPTLALFAMLLTCAPASADTLYVSPASANPSPPYATWDTAATNIQDALNITRTGDVVVVTNGLYASGTGGGPYACRINVTNAVTVQSVNGPGVTIIDGSGAVQCAVLYEGVRLSGFTLRNGRATGVGGGVLGITNSAGRMPVIDHCLILSNSAVYIGGGVSLGILSNCTVAYNFVSLTDGGGVDSCAVFNSLLFSNSAPQGGGCAGSTLYDCIVSGNTARSGYGGGAYFSALNNSLVVSNSAPGAMGVGGALNCDLTNCTVCGNSGGYVGGVAPSQLPPAGTLIKNSIVYYNTPKNWDSHAFYVDFTNSCTTPLPAGAANLADQPLFANLPEGDFHLAADSPCINVGNNAFVTTATDLDGHPRIVDGTVDLGAYEFRNRPWLQSSFPPGGQLILTWTSPIYQLQTASTPSAGFTNIPGATSPYTNTFPDPQRYFRLSGY